MYCRHDSTMMVIILRLRNCVLMKYYAHAPDAQHQRNWLYGRAYRSSAEHDRKRHRRELYFIWENTILHLLDLRFRVLWLYLTTRISFAGFASWWQLIMAIYIIIVPTIWRLQRSSDLSTFNNKTFRPLKSNRLNNYVIIIYTAVI